MKIYLKKPRSGVYAEGNYNFDTRETIVYSGAQVSSDVREYKSTMASDKLNELRAKFVKDNILQQDLTFSSASTAGFFVTGRSTNGMVAWKNEENIKIGELFNPEDYL